MADSRGRAEWARMSCLMALIANIMRDPKKSSPAKPGDFNPYLQRKQTVTKAPVSILRDIWCKGQEKKIIEK